MTAAISELAIESHGKDKTVLPLDWREPVNDVAVADSLKRSHDAHGLVCQSGMGVTGHWSLPWSSRRVLTEVEPGRRGVSHDFDRKSLSQRRRHARRCACSVQRMEQQRDIAWLKDRRVIALAAACLIAGFLIAAFLVGKPRHLAPDWGDIPTWLAVVVATAGSWIALSQLSEQKDVLKQDAQDRRRAQAARVFIGAPRDGGSRVVSYVQNASDFPIYEAEFWYLCRDGHLPDRGDNHKYFGTILPAGVHVGEKKLPPEEALRRTVLTFRDANNLRWIRMPGGILHEESAPPTRESVRAALCGLPLELGPGGAAEHRGSGDTGRSASVPGEDSGALDSSGMDAPDTGRGPGGSRTG